MYKAQRSGVKALYLGASRTIREREAEIEPVLEIRTAQSLRDGDSPGFIFAPFLYFPIWASQKNGIFCVST
jgi:hypothetical protein